MIEVGESGWACLLVWIFWRVGDVGLVEVFDATVAELAPVGDEDGPSGVTGRGRRIWVGGWGGRVWNQEVIRWGFRCIQVVSFIGHLGYLRFYRSIGRQQDRLAGSILELVSEGLVWGLAIFFW